MTRSVADTAPQTTTTNVPLGTLIFRAGLLSEEQLEEALDDSVKRGKRLGQVLVERDLLEESEIARLLGEQRGFPFVALAEREVDPTAAALLPREAACLNHALPFAFEDGVPVDAIDDPADEVAMRNVRALIGRDVRFAVATRSEILDLLSPAVEGDADDDRAAPAPSSGEAPTAPPAAARSANGGAVRIVLRVAGGERVGVGEYENAYKAEEEAKALIRRIAMSSASEWPNVGGRFLRPETIVSVDLEPVSDETRA